MHGRAERQKAEKQFLSEAPDTEKEALENFRKVVKRRNTEIIKRHRGSRKTKTSTSPASKDSLMPSTSLAQGQPKLGKLKGSVRKWGASGGKKVAVHRAPRAYG